MRVAVWQGFDHYWENDPHRLNQFGSAISTNGGERGEHGDVAFHSHMSIGRFPPDRCHTYTIVDEVGTPSTGFVDGRCSVRLCGRVGESAEAQGEAVTVALPRTGLSATAILRGFHIKTTNFRHGFHTRGFGFLLDEIAVREADGCSTISFVPRFFIFPDKSPDPSTDPERLMWRVLPFPDSVEPRTPPEFEYKITLYYRILYDDAAKIRFTPCRVRERARSGDYPSRYPRADLPAEIQGEPGGAFQTGTVGIRGFCWELRDWSRTRYQGRYLRKLKFIIDGMEYDPHTGKVTFDPEMFFSNYGVRDGRRDAEDERRRWLAFFRHREWPLSDRVRTFSRLLMGSYGFEAEYTLQATLIQLKAARETQPQLMYQPIASQGPGTRAVRSLLSAVRRRGRPRRARSRPREARRRVRQM